MNSEQILKKIHKYKTKLYCCNDFHKNEIYKQKINYYTSLLDNQNGKGLFSFKTQEEKKAILEESEKRKKLIKDKQENEKLLIEKQKKEKESLEEQRKETLKKDVNELFILINKRTKNLLQLYINKFENKKKSMDQYYVYMLTKNNILNFETADSIKKILKKMDEFYNNCIKNVKNINTKDCKSKFNYIFNNIYTINVMNNIIFINKDKQTELEKAILEEVKKDITIEMDSYKKEKSKDVKKIIEKYINDEKKITDEKLILIKKIIKKESENSDRIIDLYKKIKNSFT